LHYDDDAETKPESSSDGYEKDRDLLQGREAIQDNGTVQDAKPCIKRRDVSCPGPNELPSPKRILPTSEHEAGIRDEDIMDELELTELDEEAISTLETCAEVRVLYTEGIHGGDHTSDSLPLKSRASGNRPSLIIALKLRRKDLPDDRPTQDTVDRVHESAEEVQETAEEVRKNCGGGKKKLRRR
jgi:hypothetical protein